MESNLGDRVKRLRGSERVAAIREAVEAFAVSGQSRSSFSREVGIAPVTLSRWMAEVSGAHAAAPSASTFVEVGAQQDAGGFHLTLPDGVSVRVPSEFRERDLLRLLRTMAAVC